MPEIRHRVVVAAPLANVYEAVATVEGISECWTRDGVKGVANVGGELSFHFGKPEPSAVMQITRLNGGGNVNWTCVQGADEWVGTEVSFDLTSVGEETVVLFEHTGLESSERFYGSLQCSLSVFLVKSEEPSRDGSGNALPR